MSATAQRLAGPESGTGPHLGYADRHSAHDRIDVFAEAPGDPLWILPDPDRAAAGPFGGTVTHGFLTLSTIPVLQFGMAHHGWVTAEGGRSPTAPA
ncbi:MaoC/PaaZ C-terminal domain-containing protein [Streptomyces sp. NPDC060035]|uniref:MaoC/PaaZ C-terminal domain-containing protein n=1 Tax=Streptomyces sp. NPDC060035 TaxID=3347044 RepID=UPI0036BE1657